MASFLVHIVPLLALLWELLVHATKYRRAWWHVVLLLVANVGYYWWTTYLYRMNNNKVDALSANPRLYCASACRFLVDVSVFGPTCSRPHAHAFWERGRLHGGKLLLRYALNRLSLHNCASPK